MSQTTGISSTSTSQAASSISNIQLTTNALAEYAKITGIDLSKNPFATALEQANSPEAILQLFQQRERAFKGYGDGNRQLVRCLSPAVNVIQAFSGILGEVGSLVSHKDDLISYYSFERTPPGPLPTSEGFVCWDRCSPRCTSLKCALYSFHL
jgi:hypothetical protein